MSKYDDSYSTGLYKQKYFCQMCNRQCQDRDGFNCHLKTETHKRHVEIVSRNPEEFINKFSYEFESGFLDILKRTHSDDFVSANSIYHQYITDKFSTHLNATKWTSLTGFLKHLQTDGKCELMLTDKEIKIKYIDLTPESILGKRDKEKKVRLQLKDEKRRNEEMKKIFEMADREKNEMEKNRQCNEKYSFVDPESFKNISISFDNNFRNKNIAKPQNFTMNINSKQLKSDKKEKVSEDFENEKVRETFLGNKRKDGVENKVFPSKTAKIEVNENVHNNEEDEEIDLVNDPWLRRGLIVRIKDKQLNNGKYFNKKALILNLLENNVYIAEAELISDETYLNKIRIKIDQAFLEPVIPSEDSEVVILFGKHKDLTGRLKQIKLNLKQCQVILFSSSETIPTKLNNICKYYSKK